MKKETIRNFLLWLIVYLFVLIPFFTALMKLEPGFLLPSRFTENPKIFIASCTTTILFFVCSVGSWRTGFKMVEEIKKEMNRISKN